MGIDPYIDENSSWSHCNVIKRWYGSCLLSLKTEDFDMRNATANRLRQISAEMKVLRNKAEDNGGKLTKEEEDLLDRLTDDHEELVVSMIFHMY
jgi:hypothetical protein